MLVKFLRFAPAVLLTAAMLLHAADKPKNPLPPPAAVEPYAKKKKKEKRKIIKNKKKEKFENIIIKNKRMNVNKEFKEK